MFHKLAAYKKLVRAIVLDRYFVHRLRMVTGKDGNPLNEVERDRIRLNAAQFERLSKAFDGPVNSPSPS